MSGTRLASWILVLTLLLSVGVAACTQGQVTSTPEEFYRGKTVTWIASSDAGSGTDFLARAIAPYLAKEIGATVRVENMGTDEGTNWAFNEAPKDGLALVLKSTGAVMSNDILKAPGTMYVAEKFNFVADVNPGGTVLMISPKLPYKTLEQLRAAKGLKAGGTTAKGAIAVGGAVMSAILGLDAKVITGYQGTKNLGMAIARGEVDFFVSSDNSSKQDEEDGTLVNLLVVNKERSRTVPHVPTMYELGVTVPKDMEAALNYLLSRGQALMLPPGVPTDRVEYMRKVFEKLSANQEVQGELERIMGASAPFMKGKDLQDMVASMKSNASLAEQLDEIFNKYKATQ
ncbi:MAG: hypothetical protein HYY30_05910 [Chloroflexi bacterium]|nr:hypothetical protein [Chloroflexota bacterium]